MNNNFIKSVHNMWIPKLKQHPLLESADQGMLSSLALMCHTRALETQRQKRLGYGGLYESAATPGNVPGRDAFSLGNNPQDLSDVTRGTGETFQSLFNVFIETVAATVGLDLLPIVPMAKSNVNFTVAEPVYAGGKLESAENKPYLIQVKAVLTGSPTALVKGQDYTIKTAATGGEDVGVITFVGKQRTNGYYVFKVGAFNDNSGGGGANWQTKVIKDAFDTAGSNTAIYTDASNYVGFDPDTVDYVAGFINRVGGYVGAGSDDDQDWFLGGDGVARPMSRKTGQNQNVREMGVRLWHRNFSAETINVDISYTIEQLQDYQNDYGFDLVGFGNTVIQNELTQYINAHILSEMFNYGWQHAYNINQQTGLNLNLYLDHSGNTQGSAPTNFGSDGKTSLAIPAKAGEIATNSSIRESMITLQRRLVSRLGFAADVIGKRSRRGRGDIAVMNATLGRVTKDIRNFSAASFDSSINTGSLYYIGEVDGIKCYVDPNMSFTDNRIMVARKGDQTDPGLKFSPYVLAEKISTIAEGTMAQKTRCKSRYKIVPAGSNPELNYVTFDVEYADGFGII